MTLSISAATAVCLFLNFFPDLYLSIYGQQELFVEQGVPVLRLVATAMIFMSASTVWLNAVTGSGNTRVTFLIELSAIVFYCLYVYFVLEVYYLSIFWGWMSEILYWTIIFLLSFYYMKTGKWKTKYL